MRVLRAVALLALLAVAAFAISYVLASRKPAPIGDRVTVYYVKPDGTTVVPYTVSTGPAKDRRSVAFYAATQAVAGPPGDVEAVRFPSGTFVRSVDLVGDGAVVDLSGNVKQTGGGSFTEGGMFKALVWTLTEIKGVNQVQIKVEGERLSTLPDGHLELDEPLKRSSW